MDWKHFLFSFNGRINRAKYWLSVVLNIVVLLVAAWVVGQIIETGSDPILLLVIVLGVYLLVIYVSVAIGVKRLHDRNKSGWWLLFYYLAPSSLGAAAQTDEQSSAVVLYLAASGIWLWALIELGCLRGTIGPNRYGPDPLQGRGHVLI
jgi:uncharacterized membrane protein YhaH (DUF805 family)